MEGVFRFKNWFLKALGLKHGGAYYQNFTVLIVTVLILCIYGLESALSELYIALYMYIWRAMINVEAVKCFFWHVLF